MNSLITIRGDRREIDRVMRELGVDEVQAHHHVKQLAELRARLQRQQRAAVNACVDAWAQRSGAAR